MRQIHVQTVTCNQKVSPSAGTLADVVACGRSQLWKVWNMQIMHICCGSGRWVLTRGGEQAAPASVEPLNKLGRTSS